jgi:AcrR family transcriptional regulator
VRQHSHYLIDDYHLVYDVTMHTRQRPLRTDAVRNAARIVTSAQRVFASAGLEAAMEDVAADAGVGVATVYRRFPTKDALLRVVLSRRFDEVVGAALDRAQHEVDARDAMRAALRGAVSFIAGDPNTMGAAMSSGLMTMDLAHRFFEPVAAIVRRGQDDGVFRDDLVAEDVPRIVLMLVGTLPSFEAGSDGWCRYLDLIIDMLTADRSPLSAVSPVRDHQPPPLLFDLPREPSGK